jgi:cell division protein FtsB
VTSFEPLNVHINKENKKFFIEERKGRRKKTIASIETLTTLNHLVFKISFFLRTFLKSLRPWIPHTLTKKFKVK